MLSTLVVERTIALGEIPAPTGREGGRAEVVASWWRQDGWNNVRTDDAGNVWAQVRRGSGPPLLMCAHLDTVFDEEVSHGIRERAGRLVGPSVGDDTVGVAALSAVGSLLQDRGDGGSRPVWIVATVGEEGLGNLRGIRHALSNQHGTIGAVVAVEGNYLGRVSTTGVGSLRWRIQLRGPGGHAWERSEAPSAVHAAAGLTVALADLSNDEPVGRGRATVNVGRMGGGQAINARAQEAWLEVEIRADDAGALDRMEASARSAVEGSSAGGIESTIEELGRRAAGGIARDHALAKAAVAGLASAGWSSVFVATSTDANAAYELGIPAIAVGVTTGGGEHTRLEWIEIDPIAAGLTSLVETLAGFEVSTA